MRVVVLILRSSSSLQPFLLKRRLEFEEIFTSHGHLVLIPGIDSYPRQMSLKPVFHKLKTIRTTWLSRLNIFNKMVVLFAVIPWRLLVSLAQIIRYEFVHKLAQILASVLHLKIPCKTSNFFEGIGFTFAPKLLSYDSLSQWFFFVKLARNVNGICTWSIDILRPVPEVCWVRFRGLFFSWTLSCNVHDDEHAPLRNDNVQQLSRNFAASRGRENPQ